MNQLPEQVAPGSFSDECLEIIEDTMNATIRECVMVDQFLEQGDVLNAANALLQIRINAAMTQERVENALGLPARPLNPHDEETLPSVKASGAGVSCCRCRRTVEPDSGHGSDWVWMLPRHDHGLNLCSDCVLPKDEPIIEALQSMEAAMQALIHQIA